MCKCIHIDCIVIFPWEPTTAIHDIKIYTYNTILVLYVTFVHTEISAKSLNVLCVLNHYKMLTILLCIFYICYFSSSFFYCYYYDYKLHSSYAFVILCCMGVCEYVCYYYIYSVFCRCKFIDTRFLICYCVHFSFVSVFFFLLLS